MTKLKNENFDDLTIPRNFYATFHTEYSYNLAIKTHIFPFFGQDI